MNYNSNKSTVQFSDYLEFFRVFLYHLFLLYFLFCIFILVFSVILSALPSFFIIHTFNLCSQTASHRTCPCPSISNSKFVLFIFQFPEFILQGWHCEGSVLRSLFGLLMWDQIFFDCPDVFLTPYQDAPLDLCFPSFIRSR